MKDARKLQNRFCRKTSLPLQSQLGLLIMDENIPAGSDLKDQAYKVRAAFADRYYDQDLKKQRQWYSDKANALKKRGEAIAFLVIFLGAATTFVQALPDGSWKSIVSAALGASIVIVEGWKKIARYDDTWRAYRAASERMKHERRLYVNAAGSYEERDEEKARKLFVSAVEDIISEEQQLFWSIRHGEGRLQRVDAP
jgi:hypothetical protein